MSETRLCGRTWGPSAGRRLAVITHISQPVPVCPGDLEASKGPVSGVPTFPAVSRFRLSSLPSLPGESASLFVVHVPVCLLDHSYGHSLTPRRPPSLGAPWGPVLPSLDPSVPIVPPAGCPGGLRSGFADPQGEGAGGTQAVARAGPGVGAPGSGSRGCWGSGLSTPSWRPSLERSEK